MAPTVDQQIIDMFLSVVFKYGLPALALCAVLTAISVWISRKK